ETKTFFPGFVLGDADAAELGVGEQTIDQRSAGDAAIGFLYQVLINDEVIIVRDMRELRPALDVTQGIDPRDVGFETLVDLDEAMRVEIDAGGGSVQCGSLGQAAGSYEDMGGREFVVKPVFDGKPATALALRDLFNGGAGQDADAV